MSRNYPKSFNIGLTAMMAMVASAGMGNAQILQKWDEMFIPYNGMDPDLFGSKNYPYTSDDPLRQHFHLLQTPSKSMLPKPVYFYSHTSNGTADSITESDLTTIVSADYSVISWESVSNLGEPFDFETLETCWADFELLWDWFQKNAKLYNLDRDKVVIGGRSRGSICSWLMAHSQKPAIKGLYMYDALPNDVWNYAESDVWEESVTPESPPAYLVYGPECEKPIAEDCEPSPDPNDNHNPARGQTIVERYDELGIGSKITLTDGLTNNKIGVYDYFETFVDDSLGPTAPTPTVPPTTKPSSNTNPPSKSTPSSCPTGKSLLEVNVESDSNGDKIKLVVRKRGRKRWRKVKSLSKNKFESNTLTNLSNCVNPKGCYLFNIVDKGEDGLCCDKGKGSYSYMLDGVEIHYSSFEEGKRERFAYNCKNKPSNKSCETDKNCGVQKYCSSADVCLDHTTCQADKDCLEPSNIWFQPMCMGPVTCEDGSCSKRCDLVCKNDKDCGEQQYCGSNVCLDHTTCRNDKDCLNPSNILDESLCLGYMTCEDGSCIENCLQIITTP